jgi:16S rRNA (adenine1518-N6/adenine1519-N6)-dimethyltransferase
MKKGHHFLVDGRVIDRIIQYAQLNKSDTVLEIGAGYGNLSERLAEKAGKVIAVELDASLASFLKNRFPNVEVVLGDALKVDFPAFNKAVSNLPYAISSGVTFKLFKCKFDYAILMYQYEFARRLIARPNSEEYGRLSVAAQYYADIEFLESVPRSAFRPRPEVRSAIVRIIPRPPPYRVKNEEFFMRFLTAVFSQRRKKLRNAIMKSSAMLGINSREVNRLPVGLLEKRAEALKSEELAGLADQLLEMS